MQICTPDWVKHAAFYQIFPDRFARSTKPQALARSRTLDFERANYESWTAGPTLQGYKGGNLWGVLNQLDYIQDLGCNALYLTPIFQSASNHRYHTHDYYQVDPILGGNEALLALLEAAHRRNMHVVLDGVFNHASRGFYYFNDILENGPHSPWVEWFRIEGWPLSAYDGSLPANYVGWNDNRSLPVFNHGHPDVREYIMRVGEYWIEQGIDGWRLDVAGEIEAPGFWQEFRDRVKALNSEAYIVGEVWEDSRQWLDGTQFDAVMNYLFCASTIAFVAGDRVQMDLVKLPPYEPYPALDAAGYAAKIEDLLALYPWEIQLAQFNLLDSHDTARLLTIAGGDRASVLLGTLLLITFPGAPCIYYGDEVALPGAFDPDSRRCFPPEAEWDRDLLDAHKRLLTLRRGHPALQTGNYRVISAQGMLYVFARSLDAEELTVVVNAGLEEASATIQAGALRSQPTRVLYGSARLAATDGNLSIRVPARSGCILG
ncbi:glycosidase [Rubidibacter lacunae KORDI 51-2]|uniref:Glycosidase n=1 Tax=Rubidibacter lacunae KORDI 51-2 TaxID=582515 RepID=U5DDS9_9CHRO|nr:glycoside hydrolase family 13 protein [Rubidibacter lacunae]ERN39786.1 glycosidase [Rubidibacter lacunae KORDI 51-2]